jgi:hypothetical protein
MALQFFIVVVLLVMVLWYSDKVIYLNYNMGGACGKVKCKWLSVELGLCYGLMC